MPLCTKCFFSADNLPVRDLCCRAWKKKKKTRKNRREKCSCSPLSACEMSVQHSAGLAAQKGLSPCLALELFLLCSHCSAHWMPFKEQIGVTKWPLLFKGITAAYIKHTNSLKSYPIPQPDYYSASLFFLFLLIPVITWKRFVSSHTHALLFFPSRYKIINFWLGQPLYWQNIVLTQIVVKCCTQVKIWVRIYFKVMRWDFTWGSTGIILSGDVVYAVVSLLEPWCCIQWPLEISCDINHSVIQ